MIGYNADVNYNEENRSYNGWYVFKKILTDNIGISEIFSRTAGWKRTLTETITTSEVFTRLAKWKRILTESITLSDSISRLVAWSRTLTETLHITDTYKKFFNGVQDIWDSIKRITSTDFTKRDDITTPWTNPDDVSTTFTKRTKPYLK